MQKWAIRVGFVCFSQLLRPVMFLVVWMFYVLPLRFESYMQDHSFEVNGLPKNDRAGGSKY